MLFFASCSWYSLSMISVYDTTCIEFICSFSLSFPTTHPPFPIIIDFSGLSGVIIVSSSVSSL